MHKDLDCVVSCMLQRQSHIRQTAHSAVNQWWQTPFAPSSGEEQKCNGPKIKCGVDLPGQIFYIEIRDWTTSTVSWKKQISPIESSCSIFKKTHLLLSISTLCPHIGCTNKQGDKFTYSDQVTWQSLCKSWDQSSRGVHDSADHVHSAVPAPIERQSLSCFRADSGLGWGGVKNDFTKLASWWAWI